MAGKYHIEVRNKRICFEFLIERKITILLGASASGKSTFARMIDEYNISPDSSGIEVRCDAEIQTLPLVDWEQALKEKSGRIFVIDEGFACLRSTSFSDAVMKSDNYFIIISRKPLSEIPCNLSGIYELHYEKRYIGNKQAYYTAMVKAT